MHTSQNTSQVVGILYQDFNETLNTVILCVSKCCTKLLPEGYTHFQPLPNCPDPAPTYTLCAQSSVERVIQLNYGELVEFMDLLFQSLAVAEL